MELNESSAENDSMTAGQHLIQTEQGRVSLTERKPVKSGPAGTLLRVRDRPEYRVLGRG